jgi:Fic family protein
VKTEIVSLLAKHPKGLRAEEIRSKLNLSKQEVPRPIADALAEKLITKKGEKRATTYFKK